MWKTPTRESISLLITQGLTNAEIAGYHGCGIKLIYAYLEEFGLKNNVVFVREKPVFRGEVGNTIEAHLSPSKKYRRRTCLSCSTPFQSTGNGHRVCDHCKRNRERGYLTKAYEGTATG